MGPHRDGYAPHSRLFRDPRCPTPTRIVCPTLPGSPRTEGRVEVGQGTSSATPSQSITVGGSSQE